MNKIVLSFLLMALIGCNKKETNGVIKATGTLEATEITLSSMVSGTIKEVFVDEGSKVKEGDTLVILDNTEYQLQYKLALANKEGMYYQYKLILKGTREEDIIQADAAYKSAEEDYRRMKELFTSNSISKKQLDDAETRFVIAQKNLEKLKKGSRYEEVKAAKARWEQATIQCDLIKKKLDDCVIRAPVNGVVLRKYIEKGELVNIGMAVVKISDIREMNLRIYVSESELPLLSYNQEAEVYIDAKPSKPFTGRIVYISSEAEFTPKNIQTKDERTKLVFAVKLKIDNKDGILKAGIPADVVIKNRKNYE